MPIFEDLSLSVSTSSFITCIALTLFGSVGTDSLLKSLKLTVRDCLGLAVSALENRFEPNKGIKTNRGIKIGRHVEIGFRKQKVHQSNLLYNLKEFQ